MFLKPPPEVLGATAATPVSRLRAALVALVLLAPFALYFGTVRSIVELWNSSETFAHGYVILPISLWLIWRRRENFSLYPVQPWAPGLVLVALLGAGWLAAQLGEVQVVSQYAFVAMFPAIALTLLGPRLAGSLTFPLLFLLFAVPFGEVFVAPLIQFTADFTVAAVQATGIPVLRSGTRFELPTGNWSVVEACSGVRYLISSITLGCLYAYLTYHSTLRRALFIGLSIVVPVVANGLRAYMIVMIGHLSGMALATGVDHLIYGWLFFGLVMFIMFWIGSYWREDTPALAARDKPAARPAHGAAMAAPLAVPGKGLAGMTAAVLALSAAWPALAVYNEHVNHNPAPVAFAAPGSEWAPASSFPDWKIHYMAPDARYEAAFTAPGGTHPVRLSVLYYRNQDKSKMLISSLNRLADYRDAWHETAADGRLETVGGQTFALHETTLQGPEGELLVWHWMWIGGHYTPSNPVGKLYQAQSKLLGRGDDGALIVLATPAGDRPEAARADLRAFLTAHAARIDAALQATHRH
jgi:exosortase A